MLTNYFFWSTQSWTYFAWPTLSLTLFPLDSLNHWLISSGLTWSSTCCSRLPGPLTYFPYSDLTINSFFWSDYFFWGWLFITILSRLQFVKVGWLRLENSNFKLMYVNTHTYHTYMCTHVCMWISFRRFITGCISKKKIWGGLSKVCVAKI